MLATPNEVLRLPTALLTPIQLTTNGHLVGRRGMLSTQNQVLRLPMAMVLLTAILVCILVNDNKLPLSFKPDCMPKKLRVKMWVQKPLIPSLTYQLKKKMKINQVW